MLGDGYEVSLRFGLNNVRPEWQLTWETTFLFDDAVGDLDTWGYLDSTGNAIAIDDFLQARADAGEAFDWQPPDAAYALRWRCDEWSVEHIAFNWRRVTATFRQVFEITESAGGVG